MSARKAYNDWSLEDELILAQSYPNSSMAELERIFPGRSAHSILEKVRRMRLTKTPEYMAAMLLTRAKNPCTKRMEFLEKIRHLLDRPQGMKMPEAASLLGMARTHTTTFLQLLRKSGHVHASGIRCHMRYFVTAEAAAAADVARHEDVSARRIAREAARHAAARAATAARRALRPPKPEKVPKLRVAKPVVVKVPKPPKPPKPIKIAKTPVRARPAPDQLASFKRQEASIPPDVKVQRLPGIERIYAQTERVIGGFATAGIGRYPLPASSWVAAQ